jgi:formate/nitrite transporter FocA (FNT family)
MMMRLDMVESQQQQMEKDAQELSAPSGKIVYKAIMKEGEEELERPTMALFWSGLAAGLSMGFSFVTEAILHAHLPDTEWRPLVSKLGYSVGFLIVILGRQQLFTENTLTPVLPLLKKKESRIFLNMMRLWGVVLAANLLGALAMALVLAKSNAFDDKVRAAFIELGHMAMGPRFGTILLRGIFAGWLVALLVWLLPFAETGRVWVIIIITYVIGIAHLSHIIAGAVEVFALAASQHKTWVQVITHYIIPTLIGNIIGGVTLVAAVNHAQIVAGGQGEDV